MRTLTIALAVAVLWPAGQALAWWDEGHMQIAYVAYKKLTPAVRDRADALLKLNPDYADWTAGAPEGQEKLYAFVHAATWPDDIKMKLDYYDDQVTDSTAKQIVPYGHLKHTYWHYKDALFSADDTPLPRPDAVDAVSQLKLMIAKLPANTDASEPLRSYSLSWMIHLVGDLHQPLHAIARYSAALPDKGGDRGGNEVQVVAANGATLALHAYWDGIFGAIRLCSARSSMPTMVACHPSRPTPQRRRSSIPRPGRRRASTSPRPSPTPPPCAPTSS